MANEHVFYLEMIKRYQIMVTSFQDLRGPKGGERVHDVTLKSALLKAVAN